MGEFETRARPPIPSSVSDDAQRYLAGPPFLDTSGRPTDLSDTAGWTQYIKEKDEQLATRLSRVIAELPVPVDELVLDGVTTYVARPRDAGNATPIYLFIHGGALIAGGGPMVKFFAAREAVAREMITWSIDYRMPPLHPYPAALDDSIALYRKVLEERAPEDVFVGGGSAGGNLAAALLVRAKDEGLPMPRGLVLLSPEVDLTESGDSFTTNLGIDHLLGRLTTENLLYANGNNLAHPYLSPLFADVAGFPPTFLQTGTRDLFLSNTVRMHRKLVAAGVDAELHVWEAMPHGGFGGTTPEDLEVRAAVRRFLDEHRRDSPYVSKHPGRLVRGLDP